MTTTTDRRSGPRRRISAHGHKVHLELMRYARSPAARSDGIAWVAVPVTLLVQAAETIAAAWRIEADPDASA